MAAVTEADLADVRARRDAVAAEAGEAVYDAVMQLDPTDVAALRDACIELMEQVLGPSCDMAAQAGADWYDLVREKSFGRPLGAVADAGRNPAATAGAVRAMVQSVVDGKPMEEFARALKGRASYEVQKSFSDSVTSNGDRDRIKPRWARVTQGTHDCPFCVMLASRGFVYHSATTAVDHYHDNCDCVATPGFTGTVVEGYDPDALYEKYQEWSKDHTIRQSKDRKPSQRRKEPWATVPQAVEHLRQCSGVIELEEQAERVMSWLLRKYGKDEAALKRHIVEIQATARRLHAELAVKSL